MATKKRPAPSWRTTKALADDVRYEWFAPEARVRVRRFNFKTTPLVYNNYLRPGHGLGHQARVLSAMDAMRGGVPLPPAVIVWVPEGDAGENYWRVLDGNHRVSAALALGVRSFPALVFSEGR